MVSRIRKSCFKNFSTPKTLKEMENHNKECAINYFLEKFVSKDIINRLRHSKMSAGNIF